MSLMAPSVVRKASSLSRATPLSLCALWKIVIFLRLNNSLHPQQLIPEQRLAAKYIDNKMKAVL